MSEFAEEKGVAVPQGEADQRVQPPGTAGASAVAPEHPLGALGDDLALAALAMARRFAAGATLWTLAPVWPEHASHVAVEFVHPVIVGKRALPAVAVCEPDPIPVLRSLTAAGDLLLAVSDGRDRAVNDAMRRAPAWGLTTVWVGSGDRPAPGAADHVLWLGDAPEVLARTGEFVMLYHLLWELTHVCFEHPGLLKGGDGAGACSGVEGCVTCADEGRLGEVLALEGGESSSERLASVRTAAGREIVDATLVAALRPGDLVLIHAGAAIDVVRWDSNE